LESKASALGTFWSHDYPRQQLMKKTLSAAKANDDKKTPKAKANDDKISTLNSHWFILKKIADFKK
jgi:hypothetical protein